MLPSLPSPRPRPFLRCLPGPNPLLALAVLLFTSSSWAQGTTPSSPRVEARRLLREGNKAFEQGNFPTALERFEKALKTFPSARIQYNIGQSLRELHRPVEATEAFETFLRDADRITAQERKEAASALKELEPTVARLTLTTNVPEVQITIDGRARGKTPLPAPLVLAPGSHDITLGRAGYKAVRENLKVAGGEQRRANYTLVENEAAGGSRAVAPAPVSPPAFEPNAPVASAPVAAPSPAMGTDSPTFARPPVEATPMGPLSVSTSEGWHPQTVVGVSLLVASAAAALGGGLLLSSSWSHFNDANESCTTDCDQVADKVDTRVLWSKLLFGAAALSGAGGLGALLFMPSRPGDVSQRGLMLVKQGRF